MAANNTVKVTIPKDHPMYDKIKGAKVGDKMSVHGKVTKMDDEGAECETDDCEMAKASPPKGKKMTPSEFIKSRRPID